MAQVVHREPTTLMSETAKHWLTGILTAIGAVAALIGTWIHFGPDDGKLAVFGWEWNLADIAEAWPAWLMIGGGLLAAIAMSWDAATSRAEASRGSLIAEGVIIVAGLVAAVVGTILLF